MSRGEARGGEGSVARLQFDDRTAADSARGVTHAIEGNHKFMPEGVHEECPRFDGFAASVKCQASRVSALSASNSFECWVALAAYSWNWTPLLAQRDGEARQREFRYGHRRTLAGTDLIVWIRAGAERPLFTTMQLQLEPLP